MGPRFLLELSKNSDQICRWLVQMVAQRCKYAFEEKHLVCYLKQVNFI